MSNINETVNIRVLSTVNMAPKSFSTGLLGEKTFPKPCNGLRENHPRCFLLFIL